jgi:hypothetical protein
VALTPIRHVHPGLGDALDRRYRVRREPPKLRSKPKPALPQIGPDAAGGTRDGGEALAREQGVAAAV